MKILLPVAAHLSLPQPSILNSLPMDPFENLPAELRVHILVRLSCWADLFRLTRASPIMLQQRIVFRRRIDDAIIKNSLPGDLFRHAVAVVMSPAPQLAPSRRPAEQLMTRLVADQLPDPFQERHSPTIAKLRILTWRLEVFAGDYISKAAAPYLPHAYVCLPDMAPLPVAASSSSDSRHTHLRFMDCNVARRLDVTALRPAEKYRCYRAFLRFELICRAFWNNWPLACEWTDPMTEPSPGKSPAARFNPDDHPFWDWDYINRYEGRLCPSVESEAMLSVFEYARSLHGALLWSCTHTTLPDLPFDSYPHDRRNPNPEKGLLFPYDVCFHPEMALHNEMVPGRTCPALASECIRGTHFISALACFTGLLGRMPSLLMEENKWARLGPGDVVIKHPCSVFYEQFTQVHRGGQWMTKTGPVWKICQPSGLDPSLGGPPPTLWDSLEPQVVGPDRFLSMTDCSPLFYMGAWASQRDPPRCMDCWPDVGELGSLRMDWPRTQLLLRVYRQRASSIFDDRRLYTYPGHTPVLPTMSGVEHMYDWTRCRYWRLVIWRRAMKEREQTRMPRVVSKNSGYVLLDNPDFS
ncbi:hypothetical protein ACRALDRAFT_1069096 [Sodiomyces alcalophilus JCM 7366]|uniref:uncharacterized protein n=1 Tax=Sodiomyces alcalophilus JCM 7366 TaxID=591952 RepID=UPI0039B4CB20